MLASASQPVFFPLVEIRDNDHQQYCDGGVVSVAPVMLARDLGATTIDVILLSPPDEAPPVQTVYRTFLETAGRTLELLIESSTAKDCRVRATFAGTLRLIQPQSGLTDNSLVHPQGVQGMLALGRIAGEVAWHEWAGDKHDSTLSSQRAPRPSKSLHDEIWAAERERPWRVDAITASCGATLLNACRGGGVYRNAYVSV
jgi:predicted acylesterase/phospholipase RssA